MILAIFIPADGPPEVHPINPDLKTLQKLVGGYIEAVRLEPRVVLYCNEEGKLKGLEPNCMHPSGGDILVGNLVIVGCDGEGNDVSLTAAQASKWVVRFSKLKVKVH